MERTASETNFPHVGGGAKGVFLALRYVFIIAASYLLIFESQKGVIAPVQALIIAAALTSNVGLAFVPSGTLFSRWVGAAILVADTAWVSWALQTTDAGGDHVFLLYVFVLLLAAVGENLRTVVLAAFLIGFMSLYISWGAATWTPSALLRVVFLFAVALFYGHVVTRLRGERRRAERSLELARVLEVEVAERTAELNELYERSCAAGQAKSEFMASMSHEVRTPIHIVIGYADMLIDGVATTPAEVAALGRHVRGSAMSLLGLVDGVLEIGRLESGKVPVSRRPVMMVGFVEQLRAREWITPAQGVALRWDIDPSPVVVDTDPGKLEIVVANLVTNALKYTREGSITVGFRDLPELRQVELRVDDTGPGMPPEQLARIREPFHESAAPGTHQLKGIGLGLTIVFRHAALLDAEVSVHSTVGLGTSFRVTVPYGSPPQDDRGIPVLPI
jgi:signal transduction histidine kinase